MDAKIIALGGGCGPARALEKNGLRAEALPFDYLRGSFEGVIDCIEHDFRGFFPRRLVVERAAIYRSFRGRFCSFYHHDLRDPDVVERFRGRISRFDEILRDSRRIVFLRTIVAPRFEAEVALVGAFHSIVGRKYPNLDYRLVMVLENQTRTALARIVDPRTLLFALRRTAGRLGDKLKYRNLMAARSMDGYQRILDFLRNQDVFTAVPEVDADCRLRDDDSLWFYGGVPVVNPDN